MEYGGKYKNMKFAKFYLLITFFAIGCLIVSTFWQYQQFINNYRKISFALPQNIADNVANTGNIDNELNEMLKQIQPQTTTAPATKEFQFPNGKLKFSYSSGWQKFDPESAGTEATTSDEPLLVAYMTNMPSSLIPAYLTVRTSDLSNISDVVAQYKKETSGNNLPIEFSESNIVTDSGKPVFLLESRYKIAVPTVGQMIDFAAKTAIVGDNGQFYLITIAGEKNDVEDIEKKDAIFQTIRVTTNDGNAKPENEGE